MGSSVSGTFPGRADGKGRGASAARGTRRLAPGRGGVRVFTLTQQPTRRASLVGAQDSTKELLECLDLPHDQRGGLEATLPVSRGAAHAVNKTLDLDLEDGWSEAWGWG